MTWRRAALILAALAGAGALALVFMDLDRYSPPDAGVPLSLAEDRARRLTNVRYAVSLTIPASREARVTGKLTAGFDLYDRDTPLAFDFSRPASDLQSVHVNGVRQEVSVDNGHIVLPRTDLVIGPNAVDFEFLAGDEPLNRQDELMYSLFVPARASLTLPLFDQPNIKARWQLTLHVPLGWTAVSNARQSGFVGTPERQSFIFDTTLPLPPYLFAFAAGRFAVESAEADGRTFRILHRETDPARMARNRGAIIEQHAKALRWLEDYTAIPYPFGKFDIVLIPSFQFSGMEHPGAVYYNANTLLLDESATQNQELGRANTIAHETAHMWFGDLVTMTWFNDVWMKEVFANFMAAKIVNPSFPTIDHDLRFLVQNYPAAYDVDRTAGSNPIRQPLANLNEAGTLYGAIIYQKAPIVMRQLELLVGAEVFQAGVREYLAANRYANADWLDLIRRLDERSPLDLKSWSDTWIEQAGRPTITTQLDVANGRIVKLSLVEQDPQNQGRHWPQRVTVLVSEGTRVHAFDVTVDTSEKNVERAAGLPAPQWVLPVGRGLGYGLFELDSTSAGALTAGLHTLPDALTRGAAAIALWESMLAGQIAPADLRRTLTVALSQERDELALQLFLDLSRVAFWRFTPADDRAAAAVELESLLRTGLSKATTTSERAAWFTTLRSVAVTDATLLWLESVWRRETRIAGLPLSEIDETDLAADLAVRGRPATAEMLATQETRIQNPDRRARFAFLRPALSADAMVREQFVTTLADVNNRRREAWVVDALRYIHHPLRASVSRKFVRPGLELLPEIRRTGDIFFPKRWADATLGGYQSIQTAAEVRKIVDELPSDYPERLRWILLSSADPLFRAADLLDR